MWFLHSKIYKYTQTTDSMHYLHYTFLHTFLCRENGVLNKSQYSGYNSLIQGNKWAPVVSWSFLPTSSYRNYFDHLQSLYICLLFGLLWVRFKSSLCIPCLAVVPISHTLLVVHGGTVAEGTVSHTEYRAEVLRNCIAQHAIVSPHNAKVYFKGII